MENGNIKLSPNSADNILHDKRDDKYYVIDFLKEDNKYVQGGNGIIFSLKNEEEDLEYVIKFCKFPESQYDDKKIGKRIRRFNREIEALHTARENEIMNVVQIIFDGYHEIDGEEFGYYVMEKCDSNLREYLENNDLDFYQRVLLCRKILEGIKVLNEYKIYHRDIKQDNIFFINNEPIIGDLGLSDYRNSDIYINERGELIGPTGWFSPEAINKYLVEKTPNPHSFDFIIDEKSEVFQLGKLFWYIFQGNLPIGQITINDFVPKNEDVFSLIFGMLLYSKENRLDSEKVLAGLDHYLDNN